jgi:hypothetical protein
MLMACVVWLWRRQAVAGSIMGGMAMVFTWSGAKVVSDRPLSSSGETHTALLPLSSVAVSDRQ